MGAEHKLGGCHKDDEGMRILIVEDDKKTAGFVEKAFQQAGFRTCHVADGLEGLAKATTEPFDVAVVDIMLPKLDGLSVIEGIASTGLTPVATSLETAWGLAL